MLNSNHIVNVNYISNTHVSFPRPYQASQLYRSESSATRFSQFCLSCWIDPIRIFLAVLTFLGILTLEGFLYAAFQIKYFKIIIYFFTNLGVVQNPWSDGDLFLLKTWILTSLHCGNRLCIMQQLIPVNNCQNILKISIYIMRTWLNWYISQKHTNHLWLYTHFQIPGMKAFKLSCLNICLNFGRKIFLGVGFTLPNISDTSFLPSLFCFFVLFSWMGKDHSNCTGFGRPLSIRPLCTELHKSQLELECGKHCPVIEHNS